MKIALKILDIAACIAIGYIALVSIYIIIIYPLARILSQ